MAELYNAQSNGSTAISYAAPATGQVWLSDSNNYYVFTCPVVGISAYRASSSSATFYVVVDLAAAFYNSGNRTGGPASLVAIPVDASAIDRTGDACSFRFKSYATT